MIKHEARLPKMEEHFFIVIWSFYKAKSILESSDESLHDGTVASSVATIAAAAVPVSKTMLYLDWLSYQLFCPFHLMKYCQDKNMPGVDDKI